MVEYVICSGLNQEKVVSHLYPLSRARNVEKIFSHIFIIVTVDFCGLLTKNIRSAKKQTEVRKWINCYKSKGGTCIFQFTFRSNKECKVDRLG